MKIAGINDNDIADCDNGICVSLWFQGCPHHCNGCHNPETWNISGGKEIDNKIILSDLISSINKNGIMRKLSILGGEPLAPYNFKDCKYIIEGVKRIYPQIKIYLWTGYTLEELKEMNNNDINYILSNIDILIDGRFELNKRDTSLILRGSSNQRVFKNKDGVLEQIS